jgi:hypothetical protein
MLSVTVTSTSWPGKPHQRRNLFAQSADGFAMPVQRPRLARSLRNGQRHGVCVGVVQRGLQSVGVVRDPIAHRTKLLHAAFLLLRARSAQILDEHAIGIAEAVCSRVAGWNLHRPICARGVDGCL